MTHDMREEVEHAFSCRPAALRRGPMGRIHCALCAVLPL